MEITHGIALLFAVIFFLMGMIIRKMFIWGLNIGYLVTLAIMAIVNSWEALFFIPVTILGLVSVVGFIDSAVRGDLL